MADVSPRPGGRGAVDIRPLPGVGEVREGDSIGVLLCEAAAALDAPLVDEDIVVVSQKIVSKAEGRVLALASVSPGEEARSLAADLGKDPRLVALILGESRRIVRAVGGVLITETKTGLVCANAGVDSSNVPGDETVALLPTDPDASARRIRAQVGEAAGARPGVIVADSFGRPWRVGQTDVAIGCAGVAVLDDWRGRADEHGRRLGATVIAVADELAAAADLVRDKTSRTPAVAIAGAARWRTEEDGPGAGALRREADKDLFR
jgi:coenzyme F420-0:L-glutamate ligase/coenzyme F420-1:gamma-L-glutamate ligase